MDSSSDQQEIIQGLNPDKRFRIIIALVVAIAFVECYAQYNLKKGKKNGDHHCLIISALMYGIICFLLYTSYQYDGMGHINLMWSCVSIIFAYIVGVIVFDEYINKNGYIAIGFALLAIYFSHKNDETPRN
jgi:multidrug transporter EmrE-like cation transporter